MTERIVLKHEGIPNIHEIEVYREHGGFQALEKALSMKPEAIVEEVKTSGLRGRGGAGFPCGLKWSFIPRDSGKPVYLCCNADEGEPGTFKDRHLMETDPLLLIEGITIASYALGVAHAYIYLRGEFFWIYDILQRAIEAAKKAKYLGKGILGSDFSLEITVHRGAGAYICGEETALLESLEGKRGYPRLKPPFPATVGLFSCPTAINNVETLMCIPDIVAKGGEWFAGIGTPRNTGTRVYGISGHVKKPCLVELPMGVTLRELIYEHAGGVLEDRAIKAIIPGGISTPMLTPEHLDVKADFDSLAAVGSLAGTGGVIVLDETTDIVQATMVLSRFYAHESCGQCTPCREGSPWLYKIVKRIAQGRGRPEDLDLLLDICGNMGRRTICAFADAAITPVRGALQHFRHEFEAYISRGAAVASR
ncbi:MAG: NADH oxidoreductase (quinone) subunit F [Deltaproteobacteria bacterium]|nr:MAG: NADH oxidoreductase (quinone) subunit F [Deltaproteobacteria bacterium]